jgi:hypothetical protein
VVALALVEAQVLEEVSDQEVLDNFYK